MWHDMPSKLEPAIGFILPPTEVLPGSNYSAATALIPASSKLDRIMGLVRPSNKIIIFNFTRNDTFQHFSSLSPAAKL
jgi:hypothetical protein